MATDVWVRIPKPSGPDTDWSRVPSEGRVPYNSIYPYNSAYNAYNGGDGTQGGGGSNDSWTRVPKPVT